MPRSDAVPRLSARTVAWLAERPQARALVESVWETLAELQRAGHHRGVLGALRFVLINHQPTEAGWCRACRRVSWRGLWRRCRFPCVVWRQIRGELLGHLTLGGLAPSPSRQRQERPVNGASRWAMSPLDYRVHLMVAEGDQSPDVLRARCGLPLPGSVVPHDQPPPGPRCERCQVIVVADGTAGDSCPGQGGPR